MARRLSREEGIFAGGSCGSAVAGAVKVAQREGPGKRLITLLPDHGNRYLSTFHTDEWMVERGFLDVDELTVADILRQKPPGPSSVISAGAAETVREALERMRQEDVSQMPVLDGSQVVGSLEDGATMTRVLEDGSILDADVARVMDAAYPIVRGDDPMSAALEPLKDRRGAVLVMDNGSITGLLTRFDFLKFIHAK